MLKHETATCMYVLNAVSNLDRMSITRTEYRPACEARCALCSDTHFCRLDTAIAIARCKAVLCFRRVLFRFMK